MLVPPAQAAGPPTSRAAARVEASRAPATPAERLPAYVLWILLFAVSWVPYSVTVLWRRYQQGAMLRDAYRRAFTPGGDQLPVPAPSSWASQENLFHWGGFGLCAVLAYFIVAWHPQFRRRPLIQLALVAGCLAVAWFINQLPERAYKRTDRFVAKQVVVDTSGVPDAYVQSPSSASPVARIRVQNPPQALTFVLELKKTLAEFYEEQKYFQFGVARISFDTRNNAQASARGFDVQLDATLMAQGGSGAMGDWANASMTIGNAKRHVIRCSLFRQPAAAGAPQPIDRRMDMQRGKAEGQQILLTVKYSELGVVPGQTVRVAVLDEGGSGGYGEGELLPSFQLVLK